MRANVTFAVAIALVTSPALAQAPVATSRGPLDGFDLPTAASTQMPRSVARAKRKKTPPPNSTVPVPAAPRGTPNPTAGSVASKPRDPVSFGLNWRGNNDTAGQTRVQNYGGAATGTGAEVGLKLHF